MNTSHRKKHIACLESIWFDDLPHQKRLSVVPVLDLVARLYSLEFIHLTCNTQPELEYNLGLLARRWRGRKDYGILYLAFHGDPGNIWLHQDDDPMTLEELAKRMGDRFRGWVIHFSSCKTVKLRKADEHRLMTFLEATHAAMVSGYTKDVDWTESAALELLFLGSLQRYVQMPACWNYVVKTYGDLVERTGLTAFTS